MRYEFTIYGSGISAKLTCSLLLKNGFKVCLILDQDNNKEVSNTNLVTFLSQGSLNYLSSMFTNIELFRDYPEIQTINCQLDSLSSNKSEAIKFNDYEKKSLGKIVKNTHIEKFLNDEINQSSNLHIIFSNQLKIIENNSKNVKLKLDNDKEIETDLLILSSTKENITKQLKINFIKKDLEQKALSISMKGDIQNEHLAFQKFTSDGPLALLPYSKNEASVVWSLKNNSKILSKDEGELHQIIDEHLNTYFSSTKILRIEKHKLQFTYAKNLYHKSIVLLGNIAHNIHPIAGQGLNLSIKDIALFIKQIYRYKSLGYKVNDQMLLEEFEMKRKLDNSAYSFGTFSLNGIFSSDNKFINYTSRKAFGLIEKSKYFKQLFVSSATGKDFFKSF